MALGPCTCKGPNFQSPLIYLFIIIIIRNQMRDLELGFRKSYALYFPLIKIRIPFYMNVIKMQKIV